MVVEASCCYSVRPMILGKNTVKNRLNRLKKIRATAL